MSMVGKEALGLAEAARLVRVGLAAATQNNRFMLAQLGDKAVPPVVRVEDFPKPGFMRVPNPSWRGREDEPTSGEHERGPPRGAPRSCSFASWRCRSSASVSRVVAHSRRPAPARPPGFCC